MQIDSSFAEADVGNIRPGQGVRFTVDAFPNRSFKGVVKQVRLNPTTQQNVVTYDVVVTVENPDQVLLPGMTAYVNIATAEHKNVLLVPNAALRFKPEEGAARGKPGAGHDKAEGGALVYLVEGDHLKAVRLHTGITDNRFTEVLGGRLRAGDAVVVEDSRAAGAGNRPGGTFRMRMF